MRKPPLTPNALLRWDVVSRLLPPDGFADVLEIGCGGGSVAARLAARYDYTGVELDRQSFEKAAERLAALGGRAQVYNGTTQDLPPARRFDLVCAFEVLEHIANDTDALGDWVSRLRPGGTLLLSVPASQQRFGPMDRVVGHFRRYEPEQMHRLLLDAGLVDVLVMLYGAPLGYVLEAARNAIGARIEGRALAQPIDQRIGTSGRLLQPSNWAVGLAVMTALAPFRVLQRVFPNRGVGLVARGTLPTRGASVCPAYQELNCPATESVVYPRLRNFRSNPDAYGTNGPPTLTTDRPVITDRLLSQDR